MGINNPFRKLWSRWIGLRLAAWIDKRYPPWCWAHICTDVGLGWDVLKFRRAAENSCAKDCDKHGSCWCGKMIKGREL